MTLRILIVDDEEPARRRLRDILADLAQELTIHVVGEAASGVDALARVRELSPNLVLADMHMPRMNGIELAQHLSKLEHPPAVVFITAHDDYAVRAFEVNALDYLLKPVRAARLSAALARAASTMKVPAPEALVHANPEARRYLSISERGRLTLVPVAEVIYLRAELKYVTVCTDAKEYLLEESLTRLEEEFSQTFVRVHRSVLVARNRISGFEKAPVGPDNEGETGAQWQVILHGVSERVPVSRRQWASVKEMARSS